MKAGPRQAEFVPSEGKTVTFSDVHGVDEVKDVGEITLNSRDHDLKVSTGIERCSGVPKGPDYLRYARWQTPERYSIDWVRLSCKWGTSVRCLN